MRGLLWLIGLFALAAGLAVAGRYNEGYALLVWPPYRIQISLNLLILLLVGAFVAAYSLSRLVARHPAIGLGMLRSLSERLADAERRLALAAVDVPGRLASHLLDLPGEATPDGWRVTLPWPKKDLASWLATTPESLSRALARLGRDEERRAGHRRRRRCG